MDVVGVYHYCPYGKLIENRTWEAEDARFGFQGQERDDEVAGAGNYIHYKARDYSALTSRMDRIDPLSDKFPSQSPYITSGNNPIWMIDVEGMGADYVINEYPSGWKEKHIVFQIDVYIDPKYSVPDWIIQKYKDVIEKRIKTSIHVADDEKQIFYSASVVYKDVLSSNMKFTIDEAGNKKGVIESGYVLEFTKDLIYPPNGKPLCLPNGSRLAGYCAFHGKEANTQVNNMQVMIRNPNNSEDMNKLARTGGHEIIHSGGILHPGEEGAVETLLSSPNNLMIPSRKGKSMIGTDLTPAQLEKFINQIDKDKSKNPPTPKTIENQGE